MAELLIYGATGYTGRLICDEARIRGLQPVLCGRDAEAVQRLADGYGWEARTAALDDTFRLEHVLADVSCLINAAGPFSGTWRPLVSACLRAGSDYLDVGGEIRPYEAIAAQEYAARQRGVMLLPGVGFSVVASDCLAAHVTARLPNATRIRLGIRGIDQVSRGSVRSMIEQTGGVLVVRGGSIVARPAQQLVHEFDYGDGPRPSVGLSLGGVAAVRRSQGIGDVGIYMESTGALRTMIAVDSSWGWLFATRPWQLWLQWLSRTLPVGPNASERAAGETVLVAEATNGAGEQAIARLTTPQVYTMSARSAVAVAQRVLAGERTPGFRTPSQLFGADLPLSIRGVRREDVCSSNTIPDQADMNRG